MISPPTTRAIQDALGIGNMKTRLAPTDLQHRFSAVEYPLIIAPEMWDFSLSDGQVLLRTKVGTPGRQAWGSTCFHKIGLLPALITSMKARTSRMLVAGGRGERPAEAVCWGTGLSDFFLRGSPDSRALSCDICFRGFPPKGVPWTVVVLKNCAMSSGASCWSILRVWRRRHLGDSAKTMFVNKKSGSNASARCPLIFSRR